MATISAKIQLICFIVCFLAFFSSVCSASEWSQFQMDSRNTGWVNSSSPIKNPGLAWASSTDYPGYATDVPPVIADGTAYILASGGSVLAFDKDNGTLKWKKDMDMWFQQSSTPAYGNGKLFVAINDERNNGCVFAFNAITGEELWNVSVTNKNLACPVTYFDHRIYVAEGLKGGVGTKYYYCYHENGTLLWKHATENTAGFIWCGASVAGQYLVYPTFEGTLVSLDRVTGSLADLVNLSSDLSFSKADPGMFRASAVYSGNFVYATSERGQSTGYVWKVGFDEINGTFIDDGWCTMNGFSTSTPVIYNGRVYVGNGEHGYEGNMTCLDDATGDLIWSYYVDDGVKCSPAVSVQGDDVYIYFTKAQNNGSLYCVNGSGDLMWEYNPPDANYILQGPAISGDKVYFGTNGCCLYAVQEGHLSSPIADFTSNVTSGTAPLTVQFTDLSQNATSWSWDMNGDETVDSADKHPSFTYGQEGSYNVTLTVRNGIGTDSLTRSGYVQVTDWNPWNDLDSEGSPDGTYITVSEFIEAYNCYQNSSIAPGTGASVDIGRLIVLYNAYSGSEPL